MNRKAVITAGVVAGVAVLIGVGFSQRNETDIAPKAAKAAKVDQAMDKKSDDPAQPSASDAQTAVLDSDAPTLPSFDAKLVTGKSITNGDITGPTVIHVFGSWCPTCQSEAPAFASFQREFPNASWKYIAVEDDPDAAEGFLKEYGLQDGSIVNDSDRSLATKFGLRGQPHTIFVDANGRYVVLQGPGSVGDLTARANEIGLGEASA
jgi:thiol-disulfide isomerase/thioredoxin